MISDLPPLVPGETASPIKPGRRKQKALSATHVEDSTLPITQHAARPHTKQDLEIYKRVVRLWDKSKTRLSYENLPKSLRTHKNVSSFLDRFKVVAADLPCSHTVVAHIARDGHYYIHPDLKQNRSLSVREAARLQTFPDNYYFEGTKEGQFRTAAFRQIGNAVPVLLAYRIAEILKGAYR
jgi:DNA (cytosine-5)-methyltransferase 1